MNRRNFLQAIAAALIPTAFPAKQQVRSTTLEWETSDGRVYSKQFPEIAWNTPYDSPSSSPLLLSGKEEYE